MVVSNGKQLRSVFLSPAPLNLVLLPSLQLAWDLVILVAKAFSFTVIWFLVKPMGQFSDWLMTPLQPHPKTELVVVLILCPCVMNTIQFWIFDNILKRKRPGTIAYSAYFSDEQGAGMGLGSIPLVHRDSDQMAGMEEVCTECGVVVASKGARA